MSSDIYLDCRPMKNPVNPFFHMAKQLRGMKYPDRPTMERAAALVQWYESLAAQLPEIKTDDPVMAAAIAKIAAHAGARNLMGDALTKVERILQKYSNQTAPATVEEEPGSFRIPD